MSDIKNKLFGRLLESIKKSCMKDDKMSSTRLASFFILSLIAICVFYFIGMSIYAGIVSKIVIIPGEMLIVFASLITQHQVLLGINKHHETKQKMLSPTITDKDNIVHPIIEDDIVPENER